MKLCIVLVALFAVVFGQDPCLRACPMIYRPVCGSDGKTYSNVCVMSVAACEAKTTVTTVHNGPCEEVTPAPVDPVIDTQCQTMCPMYYLAICGSDGKTYGNTCVMKAAACMAKTTITMVHMGPCDATPGPTVDPLIDTNCPMICPMNYMPICGSDGRTYGNTCELRAAACMTKTTITIVHNRACDEAIIAPVEPVTGQVIDPVIDTHCLMMCPMIYMPVCGSDGRTYGNTCELRAASCMAKTTITIAKSGPCSDIIAAPVDPVIDTHCLMMCPMIYMPVCGSNGRTYGNTCEMRAAACMAKATITMQHEGACTDTVNPLINV